MRSYTLAAMAVSAAAFGFGTAHSARADQTNTLSGPYVHDNLAIYFIHGGQQSGVVPLTLAEALLARTIEVRETGRVNSLEIENSGTADVFIQAGDIVKGGQQDRVLTVSMIVPAHSGKIAIDSYCVEQGRWNRRGAEDVKRFASSAEAMPSREVKLAMMAPAKPAVAPNTARAGNSGVGVSQGSVGGSPSRQGEVWQEVANTQSKLRSALGAPVTAAQSATSLQLSLENEQLKSTRDAYVGSLEEKAAGTDITGYVFAVNGRISGGDQYASNGLFRKMWSKQLAAAATEAISEVRKGGDKPAAATGVPTIDDVKRFLADANSHSADQRAVGTLVRQAVRDSAKTVSVENSRADGTWFQRSYIAK